MLIWPIFRALTAAKGRFGSRQLLDLMRYTCANMFEYSHRDAPTHSLYHDGAA
eukprot:m.120102 g.120102  ORF g.120102 m.120102 type:complete len:53 (-) comp15606_c0_seq1:2599-2757(-)